ncbi:hypothetical protein F4810DRAFT_666450 [Camillea tinctor]|nr:hypothetical protein F4810DRAFT_666450 [Camillea tinctor]
MVCILVYLLSSVPILTYMYTAGLGYLIFLLLFSLFLSSFFFSFFRYNLYPGTYKMECCGCITTLLDIYLFLFLSFLLFFNNISSHHRFSIPSYSMH